MLRFTLPQERLHPTFARLNWELAGNNPKRPYELFVANALWGQQGYAFQRDFLRITRDNYGAGLREIDFAKSEQARQTVNRWVEEQTRDKIKDLLQPKDVNTETLLILTNAIYFKANWKDPFDKKLTKEADFEVAPEKVVRVPMMHLRRKLLNYSVDDDFHFVELPYEGDRLAMVILLPRKKGRLAELERLVTPQRINQALVKLRQSHAELFMPRFKITFDCRLAGELSKMGMPLPFSDRADFSGITGTRELRLGDVIHKAYIHVNEEGTEAAAATAVPLRTSDVRPIRIDHPFLILIRDKATASLVFSGRIAHPQE